MVLYKLSKLRKGVGEKKCAVCGALCKTAAKMCKNCDRLSISFSPNTYRSKLSLIGPTLYLCYAVYADVIHVLG